MADGSMKLYTLRYKGKRKDPVYFDGVSIICNNFSALVFIVKQAREKVRSDSSWKTSDSINDALEIIEADTGRVVMEIESTVPETKCKSCLYKDFCPVKEDRK